LTVLLRVSTLLLAAVAESPAALAALAAADAAELALSAELCAAAAF
jgi:hypothetical protein